MNLFASVSDVGMSSKFNVHRKRLEVVAITQSVEEMAVKDVVA